MGIQRRDISGNAGTATKLKTARNIGGVSFNGTADINLPGVNAQGNQHTTGNAATATTSELIKAVDDREIEPSIAVSQRVQAFFTTWNNTNGTSPYADELLFNSYTDGSGGRANLLALNKSDIGLRIYQQNFGVGTKFTDYKDFAFTDGGNITSLPTAAVRQATAGANPGEVGTYALLKNETSNAIGPGTNHTVYNMGMGNSLTYANAVDGVISSQLPVGQVWKCMGHSLPTTSQSRVTLFLRVS